MGIFSNLSTEGLEKSEDRLGGFQPIPTDIYKGSVKLAYAGKSATSEAQSITVVLDLPTGEYRETVFITTGEGKNYFLNPNDKSKKVPLPGFTIINDICLVTTEKPLSQQITEEKVVNIYDYEARKEVPKSVQVLTDLIGKELSVAIFRELRWKQEKGDDGKYVDTEETRTQNSINKVFHYPSNYTMVEVTAQAPEPTFYGQWKEKNAGQDRDMRKNSGSAPKSGRPGAGAPSSGGAPKSSLFPGKK